MNLSPFHFTETDDLSSEIFLNMIFTSSYVFTSTNLLKITSHYFSKYFYPVLLINLMGIMPFFWSLTVYFWGNFLWSFSMSIVMTIILIYKDFLHLMADLLPQGSPKLLWSFLIMLESLSQIIRPVTLSLRLSCNLLTGHTLLSLLSEFKTSILLLFIILIFELLINLIQAYVFSMLLEMYVKEIY